MQPHTLCHCDGEDTLFVHLLYKMGVVLLAIHRLLGANDLQIMLQSESEFCHTFCGCSFIVFNWLFSSNEVSTYLFLTSCSAGGSKEARWYDNESTEIKSIFSIYKQRVYLKWIVLFSCLHLSIRGRKVGNK